MKSIAVTGTKGKSTTLQLLQTVLLSLQHNVYGSFGVDGFFYNNKMVRDGRNCNNYLELDQEKYPTDIHLSEATSFILKQGFHKKQTIDHGVFTSFDISEHEELHREVGSYLQAKKKLFACIRPEGKMIVNRDITNYREVVAGYEHLVVSYGLHPESDFRIKLKSMTSKHMIFQIIHGNKIYKLKTLLLGDFNANNMTAAFIVSRLMGYPDNKIITALQTFRGFAGRLERYDIPSRNNIVVIDYAHTHDSLGSLLALVKKIYPEKNLITIFGCGGNKSISKRMLMGKIADERSDLCCITSDNPRKESPLAICKDIIKGIKSTRYKVVLDRKEAIKTTLSNHNNSVIVIAGKGAEKIMKVKNKKAFSCNDLVSVLEWCALNEQQLLPFHRQQKEPVES